MYVSPNGYLGGAERFVLTAAVAHRLRNNFNVSILFFSTGEASKEAQNSGINCFILKNTFRFRTPLKLLKALLEIRKLVIEQSPDVLHLTMPYSHIVMSLATLGLGVKKVWFQHGPVGGKLDLVANFFSVDMIWYNSNYLMSKHRLTWPRATIKISETIISLGVQSNKNEHKLFSNPFVNLGTAGRICSAKGFHNIIIALGELKKENILKPCQFLIAGSAKTEQDKEYNKKLQYLVHSLNLSKEVQFLEHIDNMEVFYKKIDVFIHSSIIPESFGLVVAEAMASGCLVVASDTGGIRDLLKDESVGITYSSTSEYAVSELKVILSSILNINDQIKINRYRHMAISGKKTIEDNFSIENMMNQMEKLYLLLIKN